MRSLRVVIAGGGTGGHIMPALAVAQTLRQLHPTAQILFIGSQGGLEERLVADAGWPLQVLRVGKLKGAAWKVRAKTALSLVPAMLQARRHLHQFQPHVVVGVGGYASAPTVMAAKTMRPTRRRPAIILLEQNAVPGLTNRWLSRVADKIVIAFEQARAHLPAAKVMLLGNPVRPSLVASLSSATNTDTKTNAILVLGGSQGAHRINEFMLQAAPKLRDHFSDLRIHHQTGTTDASWVAQAYRDAGIDAIVSPFIEDMAAAYRNADLVISRAGATTVAELTIAAKPAILIPYPFAADDHQTANARAIVDAGGATLLPQTTTTADDLAEQIIAILSDTGRYRAMSNALKKIARPNAAHDVVALITNTATPQ